MRGTPTRRGGRRTVTPGGIVLVFTGLLALTLILLWPSLADAHREHGLHRGPVLDGAGTASMHNPPVRSRPPRRSAEASSSAAPRASTSRSTRGGIGVPGLPRIERIRCVRQCVSVTRATRGAIIRIAGSDLERVRRVVFPARRGRVRARIQARRSNALRVIVPRRAVGGRLFVVDSSGNRSNRSPRALPILPISAIPREVFPVRGPFSYGGSGSRFGAGRSGHTHQGQDLGAKCGTRLVSVKRARVVYNAWDGGAGNYVVLHNTGTRTNFVYMHMIRRSPLRVGQLVGAGRPIGRVGNTGNSYGCHLHFEYWIGPWQTGGRPIDPLPYLRSLRRR